LTGRGARTRLTGKGRRLSLQTSAVIVGKSKGEGGKKKRGEIQINEGVGEYSNYVLGRGGNGKGIGSYSTLTTSRTKGNKDFLAIRSRRLEYPEGGERDPRVVHQSGTPLRNSLVQINMWERAKGKNSSKKKD